MIAEPLSTVEEVAAKAGETIDDPQDRALAEAMIEAASAQVRLFGQAWPEAASAPRIARVITTAAATRGYLNPSGFSMERSDSVTIQRADAYAADVELTPNEKAMLRQASSGVSTLSSVPITLGKERFIPRSQGRGRSPFGFARRQQEAAVVIDDGNSTPMQFFSEEDLQWGAPFFERSGS